MRKEISKRAKVVKAHKPSYPIYKMPRFKNSLSTEQIYRFQQLRFPPQQEEQETPLQEGVRDKSSIPAARTHFKFERTLSYAFKTLSSKQTSSKQTRLKE